MDTPEVKGTCIQSVLSLLKEEHTYESVLAALSPELKKTYGKDAIAVAWYSVPSYLQLLNAIASVYAQEPEQLFMRIGRRIINDGLNSVYKVFLRLGSPVLVLKRSPALWQAYFKGSELSIIDAQPGTGEVTVSSAGPTTRLYCHTHAGGMYEAIHLTGTKNIKVTHSQCRSEGAPTCRFLFSWD